MKPQFQHEITTSFTLWLENYYLSKGEAFQNKTSTLIEVVDDRLGPGMQSFCSPHKQWVFDKSVQGANVPQSVTVNGVESARSDSLVIDYQNGRIITSGLTNPTITADYALKDFNIYVTNETEENLIIESKFDLNSRFKQDETPIPPYAQVLPAIFINNIRNINEPFSFGGQDTTSTDIRCVVMAENIYQLEGILSMFNDANKKCFAALAFEDYPITEFGDAPDFNYELLVKSRLDSNPAALHHIDRVDVSKLSDRVTRKIDPNTFIGFIDFEIATYRYPRARSPQTITFAAIVPQIQSDRTLTLNATASSSLPISYTSSDTLVATVSGNTVTFVSAGTTQITATQGGNSTYDIATPVAQNLTVVPTANNNWTPSEITTLAWYDASDTSTITKNGSNEVTTWTDKSGNSNDITGSDNPVTGASTQNSLNVIDFDGGGFFKLDTLLTPTSGNLQAFIVCKVEVVDNNADAVIAMDAPSNDWQIGAGNNSQFRGILTFDGQTDGSTTVGSNAGLTGFRIFCADFDFTDDGKYKLLVDGEQLAGTLERDYSNKLASTVEFYIFANRAENQFPQGSVAEVALLDSTSDTDRQKVEGYLAHKWGLEANLPTGHQYKNSAP